jgi:transcriptional regulator with XRE-family HTH domain
VHRATRPASTPTAQTGGRTSDSRPDGEPKEPDRIFAVRARATRPRAALALVEPERLATLRNERGMTPGHAAEHNVGIHVSQLRRYEAARSSPTLDVLRKLLIALSVSADTLVFDVARDSDEELRLQLEATQRLTDQDRELVKRFINGLLLSHEAKRLAA